MPSPSCPYLLEPTDQAVPRFIRKMLCVLPAATALTWPAILTGLSFFSVVPSPSCPWSLEPAPHTVSSLLRKKVCDVAVDTAFTPLKTWTGTRLDVWVPRTLR